jgi:hypothetical protein
MKGYIRKKVNWKLKNKDLILNIIEVLRHYKKRCLNVDNPLYCWNRKRRFLIQKYVEQLKDELRLQLKLYKFFKGRLK